MWSQFSGRSALLLTIVTATGLAQQPMAPGLYGRLEGDSYVSPTGFFKVRVPVLPELGGEIHDTENVVSFDDALNTHASIACFALDMTQKWEFETRSVREYLEYFYANFVLPDFANRFPGTTTEAAQFIPQLQGGALALYTLLPGGSAFAGRNQIIDAPATGPVVAKRGTLLFVHDQHILALSVELAERVTQPSIFRKTPEEENEILRNRLIELAHRMQFSTRPPATKT
jgi:hypothetical protein